MRVEIVPKGLYLSDCHPLGNGRGCKSNTCSARMDRQDERHRFGLSVIALAGIATMAFLGYDGYLAQQERNKSPSIEHFTDTRDQYHDTGELQPRTFHVILQGTFGDDTERYANTYADTLHQTGRIVLVHQNGAPHHIKRTINLLHQELPEHSPDNPLHLVLHGISAGGAAALHIAQQLDDDPSLKIELIIADSSPFAQEHIKAHPAFITMVDALKNTGPPLRQIVMDGAKHFDRNKHLPTRPITELTDPTFQLAASQVHLAKTALSSLNNTPPEHLPPLLYIQSANDPLIKTATAAAAITNYYEAHATPKTTYLPADQPPQYRIAHTTIPEATIAPVDLQHAQCMFVAPACQPHIEAAIADAGLPNVSDARRVRGQRINDATRWHGR